MIPMIKQLLKQLAEGPFTNLFPSNRVPNSVTRFLKKGKINPPVPVPEKFRGKLSYERDKCVGCYSCIKVCPANAIEARLVDGKRKIRIHASRCTFCSQCVDVCPVKCLHTTDEFLLANYDKNSKNLIIE